MPPPNDGTVTLERSHFETLVRRANLNSDSLELPLAVPAAPPSIVVSQVEYTGLKDIARQYANLTRNLLRGGVDEPTIRLLSQDDATIQGDNNPSPAPTMLDKDSIGGARLKSEVRGSDGYDEARRGGTDKRGHGNGSGSYGGNGAWGNHGARRQDWADAEGGADDMSFSMDAPADGCDGPVPPIQAHKRPQFDRECTRTVQLSNLPDGTTHGDITAVIRGGMLLDVFLRTHERSASVSFLHAVEARGFFDHVRKHDLYIKNKRVEVRWNERQFILSGHVANKIGNGATRNLVIRRCDPNVTEQTIREDLDHIHNLVVVKVDFLNGGCYISTNSVHNAMFARTCMMSRLKYKGTKIDWDADECAQAFAPVPTPKLKKEVPVLKKASASTANRFQLLNLDDEDDEDEITSVFRRAKNPVGITA